MNKRGSTYLHSGCMFSGKTSSLFNLAEKELYAGLFSVVFIKFSKDCRSGRANLLKSHNGLENNAIAVENLKEDPKELPNRSDIVIFIDEGQFLEGIVDFCKRQNDKGIDIYISLLLTDRNKKIWPLTLALLEEFGKITQHYAVCVICGDKEATCSRDILQNNTNEKDIVVIGGEERYIATCNYCFTVEIPYERLVHRNEVILKNKKK
jgi:thymidine kinase